MDEHMLFDMRHDYIQLIFRREKMAPKKKHFLAPKNHLPGGFSALSCYNHIEFGQLPIRNTRWIKTCCLICDTAMLYYSFTQKKIFAPKITFEAQKSAIFGFESGIFVWNCVKTNQKVQIWCWKPFIDSNCFCELLMKNRHFWGEKKRLFEYV